MTERRTRVTHVRLNDDELGRFYAAAKRFGVKPSRLHRKLIREASACGPDLLDAEMQPVRDAVRQLGAIGRNLNQITRKINSGDYSPGIDPALLVELAEHAEAVGNAVADVARRSRNRWVPKARRG